MQFLLHGAIPPDIQAALVKAKHVCHTMEELAEGVGEPRQFLAMLSKKQWNLITTDGDFLRQLYEQKIAFDGIIVQLLDTAESAIPRLFERYPRLTPRRLYMITRSRVKIRQLPGAAQA
ncbi:MAG: hypothetical protein FWD53_03265 [Phycisphaerales bacterium]|nr:hypothetical protein [Phycisphaerales bacterium]